MKLINIKKEFIKEVVLFLLTKFFDEALFARGGEYRQIIHMVGDSHRRGKFFPLPIFLPQYMNYKYLRLFVNREAQVGFKKKNKIA